jgi:hypothetical protein
MSNEVSTTNHFADQKVANIDNIPIQSGFIPFLNVAYGLSESVSKRIAQIGDFVLGGTTTLGLKIKIILVDWRLHSAIWNDNIKSGEGDCYQLSSDNRKIEDNPEWVKFNNQKLAPGLKLQTGVDGLLWLVDQNAFAIMFFKSTLQSSFSPIYKASAGGRAVEITTRAMVSKRTKNQFFIIDSTPLNRAVVGSNWEIPGINITCDINIPKDLLAGALKKFNTIEVTETASAEESGTRDR